MLMFCLSGETLTISYIDTNLPLPARRARLQEEYFFHCDCSRCKLEASGGGIKTKVTYEKSSKRGGGKGKVVAGPAAVTIPNDAPPSDMDLGASASPTEAAGDGAGSADDVTGVDVVTVTDGENVTLMSRSARNENEVHAVIGGNMGMGNNSLDRVVATRKGSRGGGRSPRRHQSPGAQAGGGMSWAGGSERPSGVDNDFGSDGDIGSTGSPYGDPGGIVRFGSPGPFGQDRTSDGNNRFSRRSPPHTPMHGGGAMAPVIDHGSFANGARLEKSKKTRGPRRRGGRGGSGPMMDPAIDGGAGMTYE